jgi:hypothetical protein
MQSTGMDVNSLILWSTGGIVYHGSDIEEGDQIIAQGMETKSIVQRKVSRITRTEMKVESRESGVRREILIAQEDVESGGYALFVSHDD